MGDEQVTQEELPLVWWFGFRQVVLRSPPGQWVVNGPYAKYDDAKRAREKAKAVDAEVSIPVCARTKEEAAGKMLP